MKNANISSLALAVIRDFIYSSFPINKSEFLYRAHFDLARLEKIEKGTEKITIDSLYEISRGLSIPVPIIIHVIEQISSNLQGYYCIHNGKIDDKNDDILILGNTFFNEVGKKDNFSYYPFVSFPSGYLYPYIFNNSSSLLQYLINDTYRIWFDSGAKGIMPEPIYPPTLNYLK